MDEHIDGEPEEEYESIPWESILRDGRDDRSRRMVLLLALVGVAIAAGVGSRLLFPANGPTPVEVPATFASVPPSTTAPATAPTTVVPSEADLMAVLPPDLSMAAATTAEWFLADYFTLDGDGRALARWSAIPPLEPPDPSWRSVVRSVEATSTRLASADRIVVTVLVRRAVVADPAVAPVEESSSYEVLVGVDGEGIRVLDLPRPVSAPTSTGVAPPVVVEGAIASLGSDVEVLGEPLAAERSGDRWRVVLGVADGAGVVWPLVVWVDDDGSPVPTA
jgi:hypothetical protein